MNPNRLERIPLHKCAQYWPDLAPHFEKVTPHSHGEWTNDQFKADVLQGRIGVIAAWHHYECIGAVAYVMHNRRNARVAYISALGGRGVTTKENWKQLQEMFKFEGATTIEAAVRPSVARLWRRLGFELKHHVIGVSL